MSSEAAQDPWALQSVRLTIALLKADAGADSTLDAWSLNDSEPMNTQALEEAMRRMRRPMHCSSSLRGQILSVTCLRPRGDELQDHQAKVAKVLNAIDNAFHPEDATVFRAMFGRTGLTVSFAELRNWMHDFILNDYTIGGDEPSEAAHSAGVAGELKFYLKHRWMQSP